MASRKRIKAEDLDSHEVRLYEFRAEWPVIDEDLTIQEVCEQAALDLDVVAVREGFEVVIRRDPQLVQEDEGGSLRVVVEAMVVPIAEHGWAAVDRLEGMAA